jgi:hypothetical protein
MNLLSRPLLRPLAAVLLLAAGLGAAEPLVSPYAPPPFTPPPGHPRVYVTARDLPALRERVRHPQNAGAWAAHRAALASDLDGTLPPPKGAKSGNADARVLAVVESAAFEHLLTGEAAHGRRAHDVLRRYLGGVVHAPKDYNTSGQAIFTIGLVYDWCFAVLTDAERAALRADVAALARSSLEVGWPPVKQRDVTGHGPEAQVQRDLLAAALAMHDEWPELWAVVAGRVFERFVPPKKFMYPARMHHQGSHYTAYRFQWEMLATLLLDRAGWPELYGPDQRHALDWMLYARRPDGQVLRDGDTHANNRAPGAYDGRAHRSFFLAGNRWGNPHYKQEFLRALPDGRPATPNGNQTLNPVEWLVFNDPEIGGRPFTELPLTRFFPSPKGAMIARTGWTDGIDSPDVVVECKVNEWHFANHQHLDAGAFQLYYRGALATDSGYYQAAVNLTDTPENAGSTGYGSLHDVNYHKRTIAHNALLVHDPAERFETTRWGRFPIANDGGQRFPNRWEEPTTHEVFLDPANRYRIGTVLAHGAGPDARRPDYSYLKGDLRDAYSEKVAAYERSFVFLPLGDPARPAALVVFDRIESSRPEFRKAWLLHGLEEPEISGQRIVYRDRRPGYRGKLTCDTLLPRAGDTTFTPVGGPGREFLVDGVNHPALLRPDGVNEGGGWRVEVSPATPRRLDHFLHVLQVGDHRPEETAPLPTELIETPTHAGARLADRVVLFAKRRDRSPEAVEFVIPGPGRCRVLVTDLAAGDWLVTGSPGEPARRVRVGADDGVVWFEAPAGPCALRRAE